MGWGEGGEKEETGETETETETLGPAWSFEPQSPLQVTHLQQDHI